MTYLWHAKTQWHHSKNLICIKSHFPWLTLMWLIPRLSARLSLVWLCLLAGGCIDWCAQSKMLLICQADWPPRSWSVKGLLWSPSSPANHRSHLTWHGAIYLVSSSWNQSFVLLGRNAQLFSPLGPFITLSLPHWRCCFAPPHFSPSTVHLCHFRYLTLQKICW